MDSSYGSTGFDRSEMTPPVPAPRYKRKLITNEDSKHSTIKQNTRMSEQTTEILPPPRRKHKPRTVNKTDELTCENNFKNINVEIDLQNNPTELGDKHSGESSPISNNKSDTEVEINSPNKNVSNLDEKVVSKASKMTDAVSVIVDSSILKNFVNNRVLDIPLSIENSSFICAEQIQDSHLHESEENRVNSSLTENTATIVGVFYKPEYSLMKLVNGNDLANPNLNNELDSAVWSRGFVHDGNKKNVVPPNESVARNAQMNKKDSEEDDSGVYFSDTKSPPHRNNDSEIADANVTDEYDTTRDLQLFKPFTSNNRDTYDNNTSELGPKMYDEVLDSFEAQTVSALREEVTGRLSLCSELNKNEVVESWLNNGDYPKKKVINSNFSEYLRNMLEVEGSERSISPFPLSTVDESSDLSDRGANDEIKFVEESYIPEACTVPSDVSETHENRNVVSSDKFLCSIDKTVVNNVNNECTEVTLCKIENISLLENPKDDVKCVEMFPCVGQSSTSFEHNSGQNRLFFKETSHPESVSPSIEHGAVNKLITFFETIQTEEDLNQENESMYEDYINEITEDDEIEQDSSLCCDTICISNSENEIGSKSVVGYENRCNSSIAKLKIDTNETLGDQYSENKALSVGSIIGANDRPTYKSELETSTICSALETNSRNEIHLFNDSCFQPVSLEERELSSPCDFEKGHFEDSSTTALVKIEQIIESQRNSFQNMRSDVSQTDQDVEELSPPIEFADKKQLPVIFDRNEMTELNCKVPNCNTSTKDLLESDDKLTPFKPTRIPVVVLTEADVKSIAIGSVELHPLESPLESNGSKGIICKGGSDAVVDFDTVDVQNRNVSESLLKNAVTVVLEKNWGSIGLKIKGDGDGIVVSDILAGGAADESGLIFKGHHSPEENQETDSYLEE